MVDIQHGKPSTYNNLKCRCDKCKAAWAEYMRPRVKKWRADKRAKETTTRESSSSDV